MDEYQQRQQQKSRRHAYRNGARFLLWWAGFRNNEASVPVLTNVQEVGDGAFVEVVLWVPRRIINE